MNDLIDFVNDYFERRQQERNADLRKRLTETGVTDEEMQALLKETDALAERWHIEAIAAYYGISFEEARKRDLAALANLDQLEAQWRDEKAGGGA